MLGYHSVRIQIITISSWHVFKYKSSFWIWFIELNMLIHNNEVKKCGKSSQTWIMQFVLSTIYNFMSEKAYKTFAYTWLFRNKQIFPPSFTRLLICLKKLKTNPNMLWSSTHLPTNFHIYTHSETYAYW